jgi:tRNA(adenine34) deaminase
MLNTAERLGGASQMFFDDVKMYDERHISFMREALDLADAAATMGEVPVGALVVRGDEILGQGHNLRESLADPTAHAEMIAIRQAAERLGSWRLEDCTLYVTLEPCAMCAGAMLLARVHTCVFGCTDPKGGFVGSVGDLSDLPALNHRFEVISGVEAHDCSQRLKVFFRSLRK